MRGFLKICRLTYSNRHTILIGIISEVQKYPSLNQKYPSDGGCLTEFKGSDMGLLNAHPSQGHCKQEACLLTTEEVSNPFPLPEDEDRLTPMRDTPGWDHRHITLEMEAGIPVRQQSYTYSLILKTFVGHLPCGGCWGGKGVNTINLVPRLLKLMGACRENWKAANFSMKSMDKNRLWTEIKNSFIRTLKWGMGYMGSCISTVWNPQERELQNLDGGTFRFNQASRYHSLHRGGQGQLQLLGEKEPQANMGAH